MCLSFLEISGIISCAVIKTQKKTEEQEGYATDLWRKEKTLEKKPRCKNIMSKHCAMSRYVSLRTMKYLSRFHFGFIWFRFGLVVRLSEALNWIYPPTVTISWSLRRERLN